MLQFPSVEVKRIKGKPKKYKRKFDIVVQVFNKVWAVIHKSIGIDVACPELITKEVFCYDCFSPIVFIAGTHSTMKKLNIYFKDTQSWKVTLTRNVTRPYLLRKLREIDPMLQKRCTRTRNKNYVRKRKTFLQLYTITNCRENCRCRKKWRNIVSQKPPTDVR